MQCKKCKAEVLDGNTYCNNCGARMKLGILPILLVVGLLLVFVVTYIWTNYSIVKIVLNNEEKIVLEPKNIIYPDINSGIKEELNKKQKQTISTIENATPIEEKKT